MFQARTVSAAAAPTAALWTELSAVEPVRVPLSPSVLACVGYGPGASRSEDPRYIQVGLPPVPGDAPRYELWHSARRVDYDRDDMIGFAHDGEVLMGQLAMLECELEPMAPATFRAYAHIVAFLERRGYPHLLRCWNYLHEINRGAADTERYRQFCVGRYQALTATPEQAREFPAGTAIGMADPGLMIYFMAAKSAGVQVENPRQTPAFHYPRQYGPRSPSFSRATLRAGAIPQLLVSGTASVIGHATQHPGDAAAQLDETLANLRALLQHAAATHLGGGDAAAWAPQTLKLYLRDRADYPAARARLEQQFGAGAPVLYLEGAICRTDLQLEIEGVFAARG